jgi:hypothetical protein
MNQPAATSAANGVLTDCLEKHWKRCREKAVRQAGKKYKRSQ